jgi:hypothetical protein
MSPTEYSEVFEDVFLSYSNTELLRPQCTNKKIDIVYTFVDASDEYWKIKYLKHNNKINTGRFDNNYILFSLKTVKKYFPSDIINTIYIVSDYQRIKDLSDLDWVKDKIVWIDHEDIIPKAFLPTFNSMTIEAFLWRIPNLLDNFLYLNDDFIIGKKIDHRDFFDKDDQPIQFYHTRKNIPSHEWFQNIKNSNKLFEDKFRLNLSLFPEHAPYHILTKHYEKVYGIFRKEIEYMFTNYKSRRYNNNCHNLIFLYGMYADYKKIAKSQKTSFSHIFSFSDDFINKINDPKKRKKFYAISAPIRKDQEKNFKKFQTLFLEE